MAAASASPKTPSFPIRTARLWLQTFRATDAEDVFAYLSRADVHRYLYSVPLARRGLAREMRRLGSRDRLERGGDALQLAIRVGERGPLVGHVVLGWLSAEHRQGEVGYVLNPAFGGQGFATEAARAMLGVGFEGLALHRIVARADARNSASIRVMERLGMAREAHLIENEFVKGEWTDEVVYALRARDWARARRTGGPGE